jgi:hypothetical protein
MNSVTYPEIWRSPNFGICDTIRIITSIGIIDVKHVRCLIRGKRRNKTLIM